MRIVIVTLCLLSSLRTADAGQLRSIVRPAPISVALKDGKQNGVRSALRTYVGLYRKQGERPSYAQAYRTERSSYRTLRTYAKHAKYDRRASSEILEPVISTPLWGQLGGKLSSHALGVAAIASTALARGLDILSSTGVVGWRSRNQVAATAQILRTAAAHEHVWNGPADSVDPEREFLSLRLDKPFDADSNIRGAVFRDQTLAFPISRFSLFRSWAARLGGGPTVEHQLYNLFFR